ncbi:MAG: molybdopterin-dependent oxidoreductase [Kofleriaceae bacterium]
MTDDDRRQRIIDGRLRLRERVQAAQAASPSMADPRPQGSGPANRHGMPRLPPDQTETRKWPVLDLGIQPEVPTSAWRRSPSTGRARSRSRSTTRRSGCGAAAGRRRQRLSLRDQVVALRRAVARGAASRRPGAGRAGRRLRLRPVSRLRRLRPTCRSPACKPDVLLVHTADGAPLTREHGGPVRVITPQLYAWKGAKWIRRLELLREDRLGFWEQRGYSNTAYPWRNDRYS